MPKKIAVGEMIKINRIHTVENDMRTVKGCFNDVVDHKKGLG